MRPSARRSVRDVSQAPRVYAACQRLGALGIRILGAVVHGMAGEEYFGSSYTKRAPAGAVQFVLVFPCVASNSAIQLRSARRKATRTSVPVSILTIR